MNFIFVTFQDKSYKIASPYLEVKCFENYDVNSALQKFNYLAFKGLNWCCSAVVILYFESRIFSLVPFKSPSQIFILCFTSSKKIDKFCIFVTKYKFQIRIDTHDLFKMLISMLLYSIWNSYQKLVEKKDMNNIFSRS